MEKEVPLCLKQTENEEGKEKIPETDRFLNGQNSFPSNVTMK